MPYADDTKCKASSSNGTGYNTSGNAPSQSVVQRVARHMAAVTGYTALDSITRSNSFVGLPSTGGGGSTAGSTNGGTNGDSRNGGC